MVASTLFLATSFASVRGWMIRPLFMHDEQATGEIAYVMADGPAMWERLRAAADLYHMHRIEQIALLDEKRSSGYNFVRHQSDSRVQREIDFLELLGVPPVKVQTVAPEAEDWLSSQSEAVGMFRKFPNKKSIVIVTSPPHTRRSFLCFHRTYPAETKIVIYSAAQPSESAETYLPIWIEYVKLAVYCMFV